MTERNHSRAPDKTQLNISCSKAFKSKIASIAEADNRTVSNWIVTTLEKMLSDEEVKQHLGIQEDENFNRSIRDSKQDAKNKSNVKAMEKRSKELNSQLAGKPSKKKKEETA